MIKNIIRKKVAVTLWVCSDEYAISKIDFSLWNSLLSLLIYQFHIEKHR